MIEGLVHYWSFKYSLNDLVSGVPLSLEENAKTTEDKYGQANSAIKFDHSKGMLPSGDYFAKEFTICFWANFHELVQSTIMYFSNNLKEDRIFIHVKNDLKLRFSIRNSPLEFVTYIDIDENKIAVDKWNHYAYTIEGNKAKIYMNGVLQQELGFLAGRKYIPAVRVTNYFGNGNSKVSLADILIFSKALTDKEILYISRA